MNQERVFLSTDLASRRELRFAAGLALGSFALFLVAVPFAKLPLAHIPAFIPAYESALVMGDLITAVMLFSQFRVLRSPAIFVLANGYVFTALIAFVHVLTFPGVFSPAGLLGAGTQSTAWLYMFWHGIFPLFVIGYALLRNKELPATGTLAALGVCLDRSTIAVKVSVLMVGALVAGLALVATLAERFLPRLIVNGSFTVEMTWVVSSCWMLSVVALGVLWRRRPRTILDLWVMIVVVSWILDIALSAVVNGGRYDVGWYGGRAYGLVAANFLLIALMPESGTHYAKMVHLSVALGSANAALEQQSLHDGLTGIANRRYFDQHLNAQIAVARRYKRTLALVLCDVDSFKAYNDQHGHVAGDACLRQIASALRSCCQRPADLVARYGGEEFALILPDTPLSGALRIAEVARDAVARLGIPHGQSSAASHVSISGGVAVLLRGIDISAEQLIAAADQELYQAKYRGRNRIASARPEPS